ncbi:hypothetical protein MtrunA17_Chr2g0330741 [Medicago truncatula]|uniref:Uncharacterized protein n=1 Tax=Medicago truncatula TaxID=3880 RepID=I3SFQ0_MEDTR|nr:unknown [Medicago truncatula]RHN76320.1 hypothetical protein MtrunA17_Chr2g0330741 [Medicago truncatula]
MSTLLRLGCKIHKNFKPEHCISLKSSIEGQREIRLRRISSLR